MIYPTFDLEHKLLFHHDLDYIAGVDEAGRGPLAGPVVAGIVVIGKDHKQIEGIRDSKTLSEKQREELFAKITNTVDSWAFGLVDNKGIDDLRILEATKSAMNQAYSKLKVKPDMSLVDGKNLKGFDFNAQTRVKGDRDHYVISAASIIAKVVRDRMLVEYDSQFPEYGFAKHKGYGTKQHREALAKYGLCEIHRRSFCKKFV
jgi:ribonuclease HII